MKRNSANGLLLLSLSLGNERSYSAANSRVKSIHSSEHWQLYLNELKESSHLVVIHFSASWCGVCEYIEPAIHAMSEKFTDVEFIKMDIDELYDVAQEFQVEVQAMPIFVLVKKGTEIDRVVCAREDELEEKVEKNRAMQA